MPVAEASRSGGEVSPDRGVTYDYCTMAITSPSTVTISDAAREQLKGLIADQPADRELGLRVFIQSGGCSGFSYGMGLDENPPREDDQVVDVEGASRCTWTRTRPSTSRAPRSTTSTS